MKRLVCLKENKIVLFREKKVLAWLIELDWLLHCLSVCLIDWLVDWLVIAWWKNYWLIVCSSWLIIEWLIADCVIEKYWLIDSLMEKYIDWFFVPVLMYCLIDWEMDWLLVVWLLVAWLIDRLLACLLACLLLLLLVWLIDWLTG